MPNQVVITSKPHLLNTLIVLIGLVWLHACKHGEQLAAPSPAVLNTDSLLFAKSNEASAFNWYLQNDSIKRSSTQSPHSKYFRVRFNNVAQTALTGEGRLPKGSTFPPGSLIVKELFDSTSAPLKLLAILYKDPQATEQANGWIWVEMKADGSRYISASEKGAQCVSCHSTGRDYVRLFDIF